MLRDFVEKKHCIFVDEVSTWQKSIEKACEPIVADGTVTAEYPEEIIKCVGKYGAYIVLMPGVAMPHSQEGTNMVKKTTVSFMKLQKPISFDDSDEEKTADLFFTLASCDHEQHLKNMSALSELLMNEELLEELHLVKCEEDLIRLADKYNL